MGDSFPPATAYSASEEEVHTEGDGDSEYSTDNRADRERPFHQPIPFDPCRS